MRRGLLVLALLGALASGCAGESTGDPFAYDDGAPLALETGPSEDRDGVAVRDVSFASGADRVEGYVVSPRDAGQGLPGAVFLHGAGGDRDEQLSSAVRLARRGAIALTITAPSREKSPPEGAAAEEAVRWQGDVVAEDVVAVRRALDLLEDDDRVDGDRLGLVGWSMGGRLGALTAAADERLRASVLVSTGAHPVSEYVAASPEELQDVVREVLEPVDPIAGVREAHGSLFLQAGRLDSVVPRAALQAVIDAAPDGARVTWYQADHALDDRAESDRLAWLADELGIGGG